ncbi:ribonuclease H-like domain-containing protein [Tanacetum coccineum]
MVKIYSVKTIQTSGIGACGDLEEEPAPTEETYAPPAPKTAKQLAAKRNQERVKSILLLAIPDEYLLKFHNVTDAKSLWEAIKSRFGGNEESMIDAIKISIEFHGASISKEDINQKFLRSLPPLWNQIALIMRNKPDIDEIDIDDLYNNLRVYKDEMKRSSSSTSTSQNLAFLSSENTSSTNEVSTASGDFGVNTAGGISQVSSTHVLMMTILDGRSGRNQGKSIFKVDTGRGNAPKMNLQYMHWWLRFIGGFDGSYVLEMETVNYALNGLISSSSSIKSSDEAVHTVNDRSANQTSLINFMLSKMRKGAFTSVNNARPVVLLANQEAHYCPIKRFTTQIPAFRPKDLKKDVKTFGVQNMTTAGTRAIVNTDRRSFMLKKGNPEIMLRGSCSAMEYVVASCHMTGQLSYRSDYEDYNGSFVAFRSGPKGGKITGLENTNDIIMDHKREFSVARTPQQNGVAERKNRTLIEVARTMLADSLLPVPFWVEAVNTSCYVLNRGNPEILLLNHAMVDSACSSHMTGNKAYLSDYEGYNGRFVAFRSDPKRDLVG